MRNLTVLTTIILLSSQLLHAQATKLYWGDQTGSNDKIQVINPDGTGKTDVFAGLPGNPAGIHINSKEGMIYWAESSTVYKGPLDFSGTKEGILLRGSQRLIEGLTSDPVEDKLYWTEYWTGIHYILRSNLDGSNIDTLDSDLTSPFDITLDVINRKMYYADQDADTIWRANLDGSNKESFLVLDASANVYGLAVSPVKGYLFWADRDVNQQIFRSDLSGNILDTISPGTFPQDIVVDEAAEKIYWNTNSGMQRCNFDGTSMEFVTGVSGSPSRMDIGDFTAPEIISIARQSPLNSITNSAEVTFRVTFSEPVLQITADDFIINTSESAAGSVGSVTHIENYKVYDVQITSVQGTGELGLEFAPGNDIMDFRGNAKGDSTGTIEGYEIMDNAPSVASVMRHDPLTENTNSDVVVFRITFSEAVVNTDVSDFKIVTGNTANGNINSISAVQENIYDVTLSGITGNGTIALDVSDTYDIEDLAGHLLDTTIAFTAQAYTIQQIPVDGGDGSGEITAVGEEAGFGFKAYVTPEPGNIITFISSHFKNNTTTIAVHDLMGKQIAIGAYPPSGDKIEVTLDEQSPAFLIVKVSTGTKAKAIKIAR